MQEICTFGSVRGGGGNIPAYSAQAVAEHVELAGAIADDDRVLEQAMMIEAAGDRGLAGQPHRLGTGDPDRDQMVGPGVLVGELPALVGHPLLDQEGRRVLLMRV